MLIEKIKELKNAKNSNYYDFKYKFNYHSNKIEGSTFSLEDVLNLMEYQQVQGTHKFDDVLETKNSLELFDFVSDTLGEPITKTLVLEFHSVLKKNTMDDERGFKGCFKKIPNRILGAIVKVAEPDEVEPKLDELIINSDNVLRYREVLAKHSVGDLYGFFSDCEQYEF